MERLAKNKALIILSAILLVFNLVILSFWLFGSQRNDHKAGKGERGMITTFLKSEIGFNEAQLQQYEAAKKQHWSGMRPLFEDLAASKQQLFQLVAAPDTTSSRIDSLADIVGDKQASIEKRMLLHFGRIRSICTPQQTAKFDSLFPGVVKKMTEGRRNK